MSFHYGVPPQNYTKFYDSSSPHSSGEYVQYVPYQYDYSTPIKRHSRKTSHTPVTSRVGGWFSPAGSPPPGADRYGYNVTPSKDPYDQIYEEQQQQKPRTTTTRVRRSSTTTKSSPRKERSSDKPAHLPTPVATEQDAVRAGIPAGYSIKNWDPTEEPIILLGSVFDANSLGKWMYDWTVYKCGASTPMAEMAGDLWLLLIKLAGKMKRARECVLRIKREEQREMIYEFIEGGQRLWKSFKLLLKDCEYFMMKAAKKQGSAILMGKNAGTEFVESIFGRERYLETTERLMHRLRVWTMRFDVNCEDIIRRPSVRPE